MTKFVTNWERRRFESITSSWVIPNTHPYEPTLARVGHRLLHSAVSLDRFAKLMILHPHMNCLKPVANMVLDQSPSFRLSSQQC